MSERQAELFGKGNEAAEPVECLGITFPDDEARRAYFLEKLRIKLREPAFREIAGFPLGSNEDILALSDPPYYTACPNPFLVDYLQWWKQVSSRTSSSPNVSPYTADIAATMRDPVLNLHAYHTKVPPKALASLILNYSRPGDVILDAYAGSGMLAIGADLCAEPPSNLDPNDDYDSTCYGPRACILSDLSPLAAHIAGTHVRRMPPELPRLAESILHEAEGEGGWLYDHSSSPRNSQRDRSALRFAVWTEYFICDNCDAELEAWDAQVDRNTTSIRKTFRCAHCDAELDATRLKRASSTEFDPLVQIARKMTRRKLRWLVLNSTNGRHERPASEEDLSSTQNALKRATALDVPVEKLPYMHMSHERNDLPRMGYEYVHTFFAPRTLYAAADLLERIQRSQVTPTVRRWLIYLLTSVLDTHLVLRNRFLIDKHHPTGTSCGPLSGTLYVPTLQCEVNVYEALRKKIRKLTSLAGRLGRERGFVSTQAAQSLELPEGSIDYIFVDPPFGANINYSDLNFISESWLRVWTNRTPEAVIDRVQDKTIREYGHLMADGLDNCFRALKPGGWLTMLFHNSKNVVWNAIQEAIERAGFVVADVRVLDKGGTTIFQDSQAAAVKKDLLISAYKPDLFSQDTIKQSTQNYSEPWGFVHEHLERLPECMREGDELIVVREREPHMLYDRMIAFFVTRGMPVPMSAGEFYSGLSERFSERDGMYFLPEQVTAYEMKRLAVKDFRQLPLFVSDEASAIRWIKQQISKKPQTFQELHPQFLKEIGGWQKHEVPLELSELLEQNFLRFDGKGDLPIQIHSYLSTNFKELRNLPKDNRSLSVKGKDRWFVPDPSKAGDLEKLRERALLREFDVYRESKHKRLKVFRLEAVRAGFKKVWQERDYPTIITVARKIPENVLQQDPRLLMWYDQALTRTGEHE